MFSGLTNQVSNWMGKKQEGEPSKEEGGESPAPPETAASPQSPDPDVVNAEKKDSITSPTKGAGKLEMLGNLGGSVKSQMSSWVGGGIGSVGSLWKKGGGEGDAPPPEGSEGPTAGSPASEKSVKGSPQEKDDDDSSATGGADSDPQLSDTSPTDETKDGQPLGAVSTKAIAGAKSFGSFLYSAASKASKSVTQASGKIKKTVVENSLLGEFNKDQEAFIKEKQEKNQGAAVAPWVGRPNEDALKEECLSLSTDRRNFVRPPPAGVDFQFDFEQWSPVAMATLAQDPNLEKMRFELVPKVIKEEDFWRNYFYRVSLICQANEVSSMAQEGGSVDRTSSVEAEPAVKGGFKQPDEEAGGAVDLSPHHEFVSDTFTTSSADIEEVKEGMKKLGLSSSKAEEEWEKELEAELQDYELVGSESEKRQLENQIENILDGDIDDLK